MSLNHVQLIGNLGKDAEMRYMQDGTAVANFSLATTEKWTTKAGEKQERTDWHRVDLFGGAAAAIGEFLTKGRQVYVEGSIRYEEWTDKDGNKRNGTKIRARRVLLLGPAKGASSGGGQRPRDRDDGAAASDQPFQATDEDVPF